ncbi:MAG: hypothetical protein ABIZ81_07230 [Opitutaceae bacterium]
MFVNKPAPIRSLHPFWPVLGPVAIALAYACAHLAWYLATPLGRVPVLDERENLILAEGMVQHSLPAEPFYRAPLYALVLAALRAIGVSGAGLFPAALLLGAVLHGINAGLIAAIAGRWFGPRGALAAGVLYAMHPVFVHYATQALDATPALTLFLAGLCTIARPLRFDPVSEKITGVNIRPWIVASVFWAAATLMRPNYLFVWATLPLLAWWSTRKGRSHLAVLSALAGASLFFLLAGWQWRISGVAGFLPWQGAYNLWAANQPGSHGRYYEQQISLTPELAAANPARAESMILYQQATGSAVVRVAEMNTYWRARFLDRVFHHPGAWLAQIARKAYALTNTWEQYNNKTYAFHKARSPWLRWNPLSWGILFILGVAGAARLVAESPRTAGAFALVVTACAASVLLFFVSARFRLPLAALATLLGGGAIAGLGFWRTWRSTSQFALLGAVVVGGFLTFSTLDEVQSKRTFVQDHALLARAAATVGDDELAFSEATAALQLQPAHPDASRLAVASYFNLLLSGTARASDEKKWLGVCKNFAARPSGDVSDLRAVAALALWRSGDQSAALTTWHALGSAPSALAARLLVQDETVHRSDLASLPVSAWSEPLVRLAGAVLKIDPPTGVTLDTPAYSENMVRTLFSRAASN